MLFTRLTGQRKIYNPSETELKEGEKLIPMGSQSTDLFL